MQVADGVAHRNTAPPILPGILITKLHPLEPLAEHVTNPVICQMNVDIVDVPLTIYVRGHWEQKGGANHVRRLDACMIIPHP